MRLQTLLLTLPVVLTACPSQREASGEDGWYDPGTQAGVEEPVAFTATPYDFPASPSEGLGAFREAIVPVTSGVGGDTIAFGADDQFPAENDCRSTVDSDLPWEVEGVVTAHPRFYFKTSGCSWDSDEKFYGSFFLEDSTGGVFIKVAHFDMGDRVRLDLRGAKTSFDLDMVYTYDLLEVVERDVPIYYQERTTPFSAEALEDIGRVWRVEGTVTTPKDTFGEFKIETDEGVTSSIGLDVELNRVSFPVGTRLHATGPLLFSYDVFSIVIMKRGQITVLD